MGPMRGDSDPPGLLRWTVCRSFLRQSVHRRYGRRNVRAGKVVALVEQRLPCRSGKRVGEAIAKVQSCWMPSLAVLPPGSPRRFELGDGDRDGFDCRMLKESIQLAAGLCPASTLDHD